MSEFRSMNYRLTRAKCSRDPFPERFSELLHSKAVVLHRLAGDAVQLSGVRQTNTNGVDVDAVSPRLLSLRDGSARVDVGHAVSDDDADVGHVRPVSVGGSVHLRPHGQQGVSCVGTPVAVGDVLNGRQHVHFGVVRVQVELQMVLSAVDDHTHSHVATINVSNEEEVGNEILHQLEVGLRHTGGGVQYKHQVDLSTGTSCDQ